LGVFEDRVHAFEWYHDGVLDWQEVQVPSSEIGATRSRYAMHECRYDKVTNTFEFGALFDVPPGMEYEEEWQGLFNVEHAHRWESIKPADAIARGKEIHLKEITEVLAALNTDFADSSRPGSPVDDSMPIDNNFATSGPLISSPNNASTFNNVDLFIPDSLDQVKRHHPATANHILTYGQPTACDAARVLNTGCP
jgi:hypothetical protein